MATARGQDRTGVLAGIARPCLVACAVVLGGVFMWHARTAFVASWQAASSVLLMAALHLVQVACSTRGWRNVVVAGGDEVGFGFLFRLRLLREGLDTLLPIPGITGEVVAAAELGRAGLPGARIAAGMIVDIAAEIAGQLAVLAAASAVLAALVTGHARVLAAAIALLLATTLGFAIAVSIGARPLGIASGLVRRLAPHIGSGLAGGIGAAERTARTILADRRAMAAALVWHAAHWALGAVETWIGFAAIGMHATVAQALSVNALGVAARSAGVIVPGSFGIQEGGFAFAGALVGLPAEAALAVSMLRRGRELTVGLLSLPLLRVGRVRDPLFAGAGEAA